MVELLLSLVSRSHSQSPDHRVSLPFTPAHFRQAADRLGRIAGTSQPRHLGVHPSAAGTIVGRISSRLRAGTESGGVLVVALEAARVTQLLSPELWAIELLCPPSSTSDAQAPHFGDRVLAT